MEKMTAEEARKEKRRRYRRGQEVTEEAKRNELRGEAKSDERITGEEATAEVG